MGERAKPFRKSILEALTALEVKGEKINQAAVIRNAKFDNGKSVGETTLYKKNKAGKHIHQDLLTKIEDAMNLQFKQKGIPTRGETISSLKSKITILDNEVSSLVDQIAQQELLYIKSKTDITIDSHIARTQETDIYILSALVKCLAPAPSNAAKHSADFVIKYELKNRDYEILKGAKLEIEGYIKDIKYSTLISFSNSNNYLK